MRAKLLGIQVIDTMLVKSKYVHWSICVLGIAGEGQLWRALFYIGNGWDFGSGGRETHIHVGMLWLPMLRIKTAPRRPTGKVDNE